MPLFKKRDEAEQLFKQAQKYTDPLKKKYDPDTAIRLLEEAIILNPEDKKYRTELDEIKADRAASSTSQYPTPKDTYLYLLPRLEVKRDCYVRFETPLPEGGYGWIVVYFDNETSIWFYYPHGEDPRQIINKRGISLPSGYNLSRWSGQNSAWFSGPKCPHSELADFIDVLFTELQGVPSSYVVTGQILIYTKKFIVATIKSYK